jgi:hypothetical protein
MILPETHRSQVQHIQESPKFQFSPGQGFEAVPFPGYTIVSPAGADDTANQSLYATLETFQQKLVEQLVPFFAPVPPSSFHLTLADLLWDDAYAHAAENPDFEPRLRQQIAQIFQDCAPISEDKPVQFQAVGLILMTRAIAICLAPIEERPYDRLLKFRRAIYQNQELIGLGIEQQYYFTAHITLGYFGKVPLADERQTLLSCIDQLNQQWLELEPQHFLVHRAELRKFDNMVHYYRQPDWATFDF